MKHCFEKQILQNLSANSADLKSNFRKTKNTVKNEKDNVIWLYLHFEAVIIGVNGQIQPKTVNQVKLQPGGCTKAVVGLYVFAV